MKPKTIILIPVFEDFKCLPILFKQIKENLDTVCDYEILLIDDGSFKDLDEKKKISNLSNVQTLTLSQNVGHQRSIAIGICYLSQKNDFDYVLIMDGDGEDNPRDARRLILHAQESQQESIYFARRDVRSEPFTFKFGYLLYRIFFRVCTGKSIKFGNFSLIPAKSLTRLSGIPELWNHYASGVLAANLPIIEISTQRSGRIAGRPKMNLISLVLHGISSITTFLSVFALRIFLFFSLATVSSLIAFIKPLGACLPTALTNNSVLIFLVLSSLTLNCLFFLLFAVSRRDQPPCNPSTFWRNFIS